MARGKANPGFESCYYPPRAKWHGRIFSLADEVRRGIALDRMYLPAEIKWRELAGGFLVPGLGVWFRGPRIWGRIAMSTCALLFTVFVVWLGYPVANLAFGLLISAHATGFVYYCGPMLAGKELRWRILLTVATLMATGFLLYSPLRNAVQNHCVTPLQVNGRVMVVQKFTPFTAVDRGDWIAYSLSGHIFSNHGYENQYGQGGMGLGPVLAMPGDRVEFSGNIYSVNGFRRPALPYMPDSGSLVVPENHWFIWPSYSISGQGDARRISGLMMDAAVVDQEQYVGKPFARWFWRRQILP